MNKGVKTVLWVTGILVVLVIALTTYSTISGNYEIGGYFSAGVIVAVFGIAFIAGTVHYIIGMVKLNKRKKNIPQEKVTKKTPLPIHTRNLYYVCIAFYAALLCFLKKEPIILGAILIIFLVATIIFYIKFRQKKVLYLYKDNAKVMNYYDMLKDSWLLFDLHRYIRGYYNTYERFVEKKCECIELYNNIEIWSCFSKELPHARDDSTCYYSFIFSKVNFESEKNINIVLCNDSSTYLHKDNIYIPKYSNLPPFVISGDVSESVCSNIEKICSDFFAKIRSKYVLTIQEGTIGLGIKDARFGRLNRIFNKDKTIKEIDEAVNEISDFLTQIKGIVEKY